MATKRFKCGYSSVLFVVVLFAATACSTPQNAYRKSYGPGPWDWDYRRGNFDRPDADRIIAAPAGARDRYYYPAPGRVVEVPVSNIGRPDPPQTEIPGISDIPEISDVPTVLPE